MSDIKSIEKDTTLPVASSQPTTEPKTSVMLLENGLVNLEKTPDHLVDM
jgi:hypothetical protein